jgi:heme/copper-type cytochrome/quinol oxidase subunit 1
MTTIETHAGASAHGRGDSARRPFLASVAQWITSSDHKKIGRIFIALSLVAAIITSVEGALLGFERISASSYALSFLSSHGAQMFADFHYVLVLGTLAPLFIGLAIAVVPLQVGSRTLSLTRVAQLGLWLWIFGNVLETVAVLSNGGPGGSRNSMVELYLLALGMIIVGLLAATVSVVATVLTSRAPGMSLENAPLFSWSALVGGIASILSLPVLLGTVVYAYVDLAHGQKAFNGSKGVSALLHWGFAQPQTFVFVVMAFGVLAELAPVAAGVRQPMRGASLTGFAVLSTAFLAGVTQSDHIIDWSGTFGHKVKTIIPFLLFNALPVLGAVIVLGVALLALKNGKARVTSAFAFALLGAGMAVLGMLGHLIYSISSTSLVGTVFEEGVTTFIVYGGVMAGIAGIIYWAPKLWGRTLPEKSALPLVALALVGTVLASLPNFVAGFANQPADQLGDFTYKGSPALWNSLTAIGHVLMLVVVLAVIALLITSVVSGEAASDDPWNGQTLEWATPSPAPANNFAALASVASAEPVLDAKPASKEVTA